MVSLAELYQRVVDTNAALDAKREEFNEVAADESQEHREAGLLREIGRMEDEVARANGDLIYRLIQHPEYLRLDAECRPPSPRYGGGRHIG